MTRNVIAFATLTLLAACADKPWSNVQDHSKNPGAPAPGQSGAPWPSCQPKDSPACAGR